MHIGRTFSWQAPSMLYVYACFPAVMQIHVMLHMNACKLVMLRGTGWPIHSRVNSPSESVGVRCNKLI